jgi:hypothetical protein
MPDFDIPYAMSVWDARDLVALEKLANENPGKAVHFEHMGYVPNDLY